MFDQELKIALGLDVAVAPAFIGPKESLLIFNELTECCDFRQYAVRMFGKSVNQPRLMDWCSDEGVAYAYSGLKLKAKAWNRPAELLREKVSRYLNHSFNSALINLYRSGRDYMGWHQDNEPELGRCPVIASVSFGASRKFSFRNRATGSSVSIILESGDLVVMSGSSQRLWMHSLPKASKCTTPRINVTFRSIIREKAVCE